jgi:hypothetical protein
MIRAMTNRRKPKNPNNVRTALIIAALALFFFVMVFVKRIWLS